jgi:hypothetical protein
MSGVFISYRRDDSVGRTGRIYDRIVGRLGADQVFIDREAIAPGADFSTVIQATLDQSETVLVIIGSGWLDSRDERGHRRLDSPEDLVRQEISVAIERDCRVIPVLVGGAEMPEEENLPAEIASLARRHAVVVSDANFGTDIQQLLRAITATQTDLESRKKVGVVVPPGRQTEELRNRIAAAIHTAGFTPIRASLTDGSDSYSGIVVAFDTLDTTEAFRLGTLFESGVPVIGVVKDPSSVPSNLEFIVFRPGTDLVPSLSAKLRDTVST